jgi:hypothetical protein
VGRESWVWVGEWVVWKGGAGLTCRLSFHDDDRDELTALSLPRYLIPPTDAPLSNCAAKQQDDGANDAQ